MPKIVKPLSEAEIRNTRPGEKVKYLFDGKGLYLEITSAGVMLWRLKFTLDGKQKLLAMGAYPDVGLKEARNRREEARRLISEGIDPGEHRKSLLRAKVERGTNTFETVAREWVIKFKSQWVSDHTEIILRQLEKDVFPWLGPLPIAEIEAPEILDVLRRIEERGAINTAHKARQKIGQILRYAIQTGRAKRDATTDLRGALPPSKSENHFAAFTDPKEFGALLLAMDGYHGSFIVRCALKLAPMLIVRPGELRRMEWADVDLDKAEWKFLVTKTKTPHIVPLAKQAVAVLRELKPLTGHGRFAFISVRFCDGSTPMSDNAVLAAIRTLGYSKEKATGHGFRASFRTIGAEVLKFRYDLMEFQLAHRVRDPLGRAYNRTEFLDERRVMMQQWADYLDELKVGRQQP